MGKGKVSNVSGNGTLLKNLKAMGILWALILICIIAAIISPNFLRPANMVNVVRSVSLNGIIAMGMTFVVLTGGVDLSVGSTVGVVAVSAAIMMQKGIHPVVTIAASLLIGIVLGLINGIGVTVGKLAPFIMTLGTMTALRGVARYIANGSPPVSYTHLDVYKRQSWHRVKARTSCWTEPSSRRELRRGMWKKLRTRIM